MRNLFDLAALQLYNEGNEDYTNSEVLDRAITIRKWIDKHKGTAEKILAGKKVYQYGNKFVTSK